MENSSNTVLLDTSFRLLFPPHNTDAYPTDLVRYVWEEQNAVDIMDTTLSQFDVTSLKKRSYVREYAAGESWKNVNLEFHWNFLSRF